ncbi:MAG: DegV family EDD domain-containing protein, partial [Lachnospiraceae bacterium]|nr:DegV family EDD domain-containing protein [Lachnospiraceae bacterium]
KVGDMLSDIVNMIWLRAEDKGLKFDVSIDPEVPTVLYGDEVRIKQIMVNLLNNAVKYTNEGSVDLHIESEILDEESVELSISISDTGMGIKKEALPFLFDAIKRVDEEKNRNIEGTGLGLSIVKQLVDLMGGTITVNSVYGEGSTFTVVLRQGVSDGTQIGELNIHNQKVTNRSAYEAGFKAPEARILIVDDNEMNLEVECRLLADTNMIIDKALSGKEALELSLKNHYDAILMDHLMPEMDGIKCLELLRSQTGGLNRNVPVIVLTANAGSDNREIYNRAGFDGYLVKPVSGEALENTLVRHLPADKLIVSQKIMSMRSDINASAGYTGKVPVVITCSSVCDLPDSVIKKLNLHVIPALIHTDEGVFKDGIQMDADELIRYIDTGRNAVSSASDEAAYTEFFANALKGAHHLIHISLISSMSDDYAMATEAAKAFDNVTVINSGTLSSASGILVLIAYKLAQQNIPVDEIIKEIYTVKERLKCSFVIDTTEYMARKEFIPPFVHKAARSLNLHPSLNFRDDKFSIGGIWMGNTKRAYRRYIHKAFPVDIIPDSDIVFVTYVDVPMDTLLWIKEEISRIAYFEHVVFKQASAAISSNCGPGTFGILYFVKSNKSYNIGSLIDDEEDGDENADDYQDEEDVYDLDVIETDSTETDKTDEEIVSAKTSPDTSAKTENTEPADDKWYQNIQGIDPDDAVKNSGSEDLLRSVLKIFYDSIPDKSSELDSYYRSEDLENYTIRIHALKSSARIIGANDLADRAQKLEDAGKEGDLNYIKEHHEDFMKDYHKYSDYLAGYVGETDGSSDDGSSKDRPVADEFLMQSVYEGLKEAASNMDCDTIEDIMAELDEYEIPQGEKDKYGRIKTAAAAYDYDGILDALS